MLERCHVGLAHGNGGTEDAGLFSFTILFCTSFEVLWCQMGPKHPVCLQMGGCIRVRIEPNFMCFAEFVTLCEVGSATRPPALTWLPTHWLSVLPPNPPTPTLLRHGTHVSLGHVPGVDIIVTTLPGWGWGGGGALSREAVMTE